MVWSEPILTAASKLIGGVKDAHGELCTALSPTGAPDSQDALGMPPDHGPHITESVSGDAATSGGSDPGLREESTPFWDLLAREFRARLEEAEGVFFSPF
jgi:hypothetical protein